MDRTKDIMKRLVEDELQRILDEVVDGAKIRFAQRLHEVPSILSKKMEVSTIVSTLEDKITIELRVNHDRINT